MKRTGTSTKNRRSNEPESPKNGRPKSVFARHGGQANYSFRVWTRLLDLFGRVAGPNNSSAMLRHLMLRYIWENRNRLRPEKETARAHSRA